MEHLIETPGRIEPVYLPEDDRGAGLVDLAATLGMEAKRLEVSHHPETVKSLRAVVVAANAQHSNAIEGHLTSIDEAFELCREPDANAARAPFIREFFAHQEVEREIDHLRLGQKSPKPTSVEFLKLAHRRLYERMPAEFSVQSHGHRSIAIIPGEFRLSPEQDVTVGRHYAPSSERVYDFMAHFERRFAGAGASQVAMTVDIAAAHHRFSYVHPFVDGNGRVGRLMTHTMAQRAGIGSGGLWSISRALNRSGDFADAYMKMMDFADSPRRGDRDGRGNLSTAALREFSDWFLSAILTEIRFAASAFDLASLESRLADLMGDQFAAVFSMILREGPVDLEALQATAGVPSHASSVIVEELTTSGFLTPMTGSTLMYARFPPKFYEILFPDLFVPAPAFGKNEERLPRP
jgi:Fic family protein